MAHEPANDFRCFVRPVVVHDYVHVTVWRQLGIDALEEFQKLLMAMAAMTLPDHLPGRDVQGREQGGRPVTDVVVGLAGGHAGPHRQERPGPVQSLHLAFLVQRQDDGAIRRKEIQPDNVAHFLDELRIRGQLERIEPMRLQAERLPDPGDRRLGETGHLGQAARRPLRRVRRGAFERARDDIDHPIISHLARRARPRPVGQTWQTTHSKPFAPFTDAVTRHAESLRHRSIGESLRARQHHPRPRRQSLRRGRAAGPLLQGAAFVVSQHDRLVVACSWHAAQRTNAATEVQGFSETRH